MPTFNQDFQKNERKSIFYSSIINELNGDTKTVLGEISILLNDDIKKDKKEDLYIDARVKLTKLQWRTVEFAIIFKNTPIEQEIKEYQKQLTLMEKLIVDNKNGAQAVSEQRQKIEDFAYSSARLLKALAEQADITIDK